MDFDLRVGDERGCALRKNHQTHGSGRGIRAIADYLNRKGLTHRHKDRKFTSGLVHQILTREAYAGTHYFNRTEFRRRRNKDKAEWIAFATPVIIHPEIFQEIRNKLESRRPTRIPPRLVDGPTLLTGIAKCASCGGGMTIRTGKGGRYRNAILADLLTLLRQWWKAGRQQGVMLHAQGWPFPGQDATKPISTRHLRRIVVEAAQAR